MTDNNNDSLHKTKFINMKKERREKKRTKKRDITAEEVIVIVIFIFEKVLENWKTIKIFNTIIQQNPKSLITKKKVEVIASGNCKIYVNELSVERYEYYKILRKKVYEYHKKEFKVDPSIWGVTQPTIISLSINCGPW